MLKPHNAPSSNNPPQVKKSIKQILSGQNKPLNHSVNNGIDKENLYNVPSMVKHSSEKDDSSTMKNHSQKLSSQNDNDKLMLAKKLIIKNAKNNQLKKQENIEVQKLRM